MCIRDRHQEACQCAVTAAVGVNNFRMDDFAVRNFIKLELFGVTEMLKNLTVFIGNCKFHKDVYKSQLIHRADPPAIAAPGRPEIHQNRLLLPDQLLKLLPVSYTHLDVYQRQVVVLSGGIVAEQGSPAELYARKGLYAHMVDLQSTSQSWTI